MSTIPPKIPRPPVLPTVGPRSVMFQGDFISEIERAHQAVYDQYRLPSESKELFTAFQRQLTDDFTKSLDIEGLDVLKQWKSLLLSEAG